MIHLMIKRNLGHHLMQTFLSCGKTQSQLVVHLFTIIIRASVREQFSAAQSHWMSHSLGLIRMPVVLLARPAPASLRLKKYLPRLRRPRVSTLGTGLPRLWGPTQGY